MERVPNKVGQTSSKSFKHSWKIHDDIQLMKLIDKFGEKCWTTISKKMHRKGCLSIYYRFKLLCKELVKDNYWTEIENICLLKAGPSVKSDLVNWKSVQADFSNFFRKYVPVFLLNRRRKVLISNNYHLSLSDSHSIEEVNQMNSNYRSLQQCDSISSIDSIEAVSENKFKKISEDYSRSSFQNESTQLIDSCLNKDEGFHENYLFDTDSDCTDLPLQENNETYEAKLLKIAVGKDISEFKTNYINKNLSKSPFVISKIPKNVKFSHNKRHALNRLKAVNKELISQNLKLINNVNHLLTKNFKIDDSLLEPEPDTPSHVNISQNSSKSSPKVEEVANLILKSSNVDDKQSMNVIFETNMSVHESNTSAFEISLFKNLLSPFDLQKDINIFVRNFLS